MILSLFRNLAFFIKEFILFHLNIFVHLYCWFKQRYFSSCMLSIMKNIINYIYNLLLTCRHSSIEFFLSLQAKLSGCQNSVMNSFFQGNSWKLFFKVKQGFQRKQLFNYNCFCLSIVISEDWNGILQAFGVDFPTSSTSCHWYNLESSRIFVWRHLLLHWPPILFLIQ